MAANALYDTRFLNSARLQRIIEVAAPILERERPLLYLDRLNMVNAVDDEIFGRFTSRLFAADIITDGHKAVVYEGGKVDLVLNTLPNIKIGQNLSQATLNLLNRLMENPRAQEEDALFDWELRFGEVLVQGVRERMNEMAGAMMIDAYSYDRFGVKLAGATWGMPANLKVTVSPAWSLDAGVTSNTANARPIRDLLSINEVDASNYGLGPFDRITMSSTAFFRMVETTEFQSRANLFSGINFALASNMLALEDRVRMTQLAGKVLNMEVVIDDKTIRIQSSTGAQSTARVLPANKVLLDRKANGPREWDWGNGIVTESIVSSLIGAPVLGEQPARFDLGGNYGPLGYYTAQSSDLNPPGVNGWSVCRGWPRKFVFECSSVLTVW
jgi:hypothetical protein